MFAVAWQAVKDSVDELFVLMAVNFVYVLMNLPLLGLGGMMLLNNGALSLASLVLVLSVLVLGPANAGLYTVAQQITEGRAVKTRVFFEGLRQHYKLGWQVYGAWMAGFVLILINLQFYTQINSVVGLALVILLLDVLLIWVSLLIYIGPLMLLQTDKRLRIIARNAFLMALGRPLFTLVTLVLMVLILGVSTFLSLLLFIITFAFLAVWSFRATLKLIKDAEDRRTAQNEQAEQSRLSKEKGRGGQIRPWE